MRGDRNTYQPALDGVRAIAVTVVLLFHAGFGWMSGGYFGVSVFFTLSGFLITRLLITEHDESGSVSLRRFYSRRAKRLMPASLLCIAIVLVLRLGGAFDAVETLRRDAAGSLFEVFNWVRLSGHSSYADLFRDGTTSPFEHFWSLAIEEQFYVLWPLSLAGLLVLARRRRWSIGVLVVIVTVLFAAAAPVIALVFGTDAAYWATPARLAEILLGASLAAWINQRRVSPNAARLAGPALAVVLVLCCVLPASGGPAYIGLFPVLAISSAALILGLQVPGRVRSLLSHTSLVAVGKVSYGLYLFHWPVFVLLRDRGWDLSSPRGFAVAMSITSAVTIASYWAIERPVRRATWPIRRTGVLAAIAVSMATVVVVVAPGARPLIELDSKVLAQADIQPADSLVALRPPPTTVTPATSTTPPTTSTSAAPSASSTTSTSTSSPSTTTTITTTTTTTLQPVLDEPAAPPRPVRILTVGDSTAAMLNYGLAQWAVDHPTYAQSTLLWAVGCGFVLSGKTRDADTDQYAEHAKDVIQHDVPSVVAELKPDIVVLMNSMNDIEDRMWFVEEGLLSPEDSGFQEHMLRDYRTMTKTLIDEGVPTVVWVLPVTPRGLFTDHPVLGDPERFAVQRKVIAEIAAEFPTQVALIDLEGWSKATGKADDPNWRPDGLHLSGDSSKEFSTLYLGPRLVAIATGQ